MATQTGSETLPHLIGISELKSAKFQQLGILKLTGSVFVHVDEILYSIKDLKFVLTIWAQNDDDGWKYTLSSLTSVMFT